MDKTVVIHPPDRGEVRSGAQRAAEAFTRAALERGAVDVTYSPVDSPWGKLLAAATSRGLVRLAFPEESTDQVLERLAHELSPRILEASAGFDDVRRELDEYFDGRRRVFDLPLDWSLIRGFRQPVLRVTARIPFGETRTYHQVARSAGNEKASRAAGGALGSNPIPIVIPCHRVLRTGGALGGYGGGLDRKLWLLKHEGALLT